MINKWIMDDGSNNNSTGLARLQWQCIHLSSPSCTFLQFLLQSGVCSVCSVVPVTAWRYTGAGAAATRRPTENSPINVGKLLI